MRRCCAFCPTSRISFFLFKQPATTALYTLSLHDALPIFILYTNQDFWLNVDTTSYAGDGLWIADYVTAGKPRDRKSTRLNSSHRCISYAVFCLKKKKKDNIRHTRPQTIPSNTYNEKRNTP